FRRVLFRSLSDLLARNLEEASRVPAPTDYETVLARLATDVDEAKTHLSEIRLRERRSSLLVNVYGIAVWAVWLGLWWVKGLPLGLLGWSPDRYEWKLAGTGGAALGPIGIYLLNRLLHYYFYRQRNAEEQHLRVLLAQQRKQLDAIKKATNYDSTRKLIERYDESGSPKMGMPMNASPSTPTRKMPVSPSPASRGDTPRAPGHLLGAGGTPGRSPGSPVAVPLGISPEDAVALQLQVQAIQPVLPTPEKKWYDRVVDSILGEDPSQAAQSKYALRVYADDAIGCNHKNPSPLSRFKSDPSVPSAANPEPSSQLTPSPLSPSQTLPRASSRPRRPAGERGTPRVSKLGREVFSASTDAEADEEGEADGGGNMEIDEEA
ncbi:MAG: hypothetical protein TREMPRED_005203, partial [Tremellales sp. Tagirdzhanova-0007]